MTDMQQRPEEEEDNIPSFIAVGELQKYGIQVADINKLKAGGIHTVTGVTMQTKKALTSLKGLSEGKVDKILEACMKIQNGLFITGFECLHKRASVVKLTTGSKSLDKLLGGGIETQSITEAFGEFRTGKTQIAHTLAVTAQLARQDGGGQGRVAYIDTEGTFRPERIGPIADRYGLDRDEVLENIVYGRAYTHEHQDALVTAIAAKMVEERFALLVQNRNSHFYPSR
eukprot:TRINITY_DN837_c0_g1_i9.p1 TRINITY_DN837_c0_g1~~TRINITY_DN837_c0_g1_i9.p1  ORF type:complete len:228 (-),score=36.33 TRINITY_DN837_c0_g1_i9:462-1145(-)